MSFTITKNIHILSFLYLVILLVYYHFEIFYALFCFAGDKLSIGIEKSKNGLKKDQDKERPSMPRHK